MGNKISIIVPVYNGEKYIDRCISSLISQTYSNIEIVIVNDGSTDNTLLISNKYKTNDNRIIIINKPNGGLSSARNCGLNNFCGDYVMFVDADDYLDKDACLIINKNIEKNKELYIYDNYLINKSCIAKCRNSKKYKTVNHIILNAITPLNINNNGLLRSACAKVYSKEIIHNIRFDETIEIWEDFHFICLLLHKLNTLDKIKFISESWYYYDKSNVLSLTNKINHKLYDSLVSELNFIINVTNEMNNIDKIDVNTTLCKFCWDNFWILYYKDQYIHNSVDCIKWYEKSSEYINNNNIYKIILQDSNANKYFKFRSFLRLKLIRKVVENFILKRNKFLI